MLEHSNTRQTMMRRTDKRHSAPGAVALGQALVPSMLERMADNTVALGEYVDATELGHSRVNAGALGHALGTKGREQAVHAKYAVHTGQTVHAGHDVQ